jgi:hypothetical protein
VETWDGDEEYAWWAEPGGIIVYGLPDAQLRFSRVTGRWSCTCGKFHRLGKCVHLLLYRRQAYLNVKEEYL